jgi:hypothetical protein
MAWMLMVGTLARSWAQREEGMQATRGRFSGLAWWSSTARARSGSGRASWSGERGGKCLRC